MKLDIRHACLPAALAVAAIVSLGAQAPKPKHINRAIELLEAGQPIYYTGSHNGTEGTFEAGKLDAQTWADYISYDMEHAPYDVKGLAEYMRGLAAGGPTKSGHRTPAVIVNVPVNGIDEAAVRANAWMFSQVLATGVHGILLTHADTPGAVRAFVEMSRLPIHKQGVGKGVDEGRRGAHGTPNAAQIWGVSQQEYEDKADAWPLNPNGELCSASSSRTSTRWPTPIRTSRCRASRSPNGAPATWRCRSACAVPATSLRKTRRCSPRARRSSPPARPTRVFFLNSMNQNTVVDLIKEGVMIGPANQRAAEIGRQFTKRTMPW